jgi:glutamate racemase
MRFFLDREVKAVVVACNTATAAAIAGLRAHYPIPFIGVEPAVKPAATASKSGVVGVLATSGTISSDKYLHLQSRFNQQVEIITNACPGLVELIENPQGAEHDLQSLLRQFITPMLDKGADTLVLGCTHYSLVKHAIREIVGEAVTIVDAGDAVARELQRRLDALQLLSEAEAGSVGFFTSGDPTQQEILLGRYWNQPLQVQNLL